MREPRPHVIGFAAGLLLLASTTTAIDRLLEPEVAMPTVTAVPVGDDGAGTDAAPGAEDASGEVGAVLADGDRTSPDDDPTVGPGTDPSTQPPTATADGSGPTPPTTTSPADGGPAPSQPSATASPDRPSPTTTPDGPASPQPSFPSAGLYEGDAATRGISADRLVMCGHAALALGAAFDTSREDLNVYWDMVNDAGGVDGRQVEMSWEDDAYLSDQAVRAATTCADKDPFMILGGIGFDQIPGVRDWAEANSELYLHHIAVAPTRTYDYSFSLSPTVELVGEESGNYLAREHGDARVGVMYRNTANWTPGSDAGIAVMERAGMDVDRYPVVQNQGVYTQELNAMRVAGVETVWVWENALNAGQIINQAEEIGYFPTWVVFPFQTTIDLLGDPTAHDIEGVAAWPSYAPGGYGGAHADFRVDEEIAAFEAAYARYRPGTTPNDLLWQVWVGNRVLHRMIEDCGPACDRNTFAGMMLSGYEMQVDPACRVDFGDRRSFGGHHGGFAFFTQELFEPSSGPAFRTTAYCRPTLRG